MARTTADGVGTDLGLSGEEKSLLKRIAKNAIEETLLDAKEEPLQVPERLREKRGAFVCLKTRGELKGCIGYIRGTMPLDTTVRQMAREAAFNDPRFAPLDRSEWKDTEIEISVLTPMKRISDVEEIQVGVHGIYIEQGFHSGLLLPQVAVENDWDRTTFLEYTCMKAGLPRDAWRSRSTNIYIFSADVF